MSDPPDAHPTPLEIVRVAEGTELRYEPDEPGERLELLPPLSKGAIDELVARIPCPLPQPIRELLEHTRGFANGPLESLKFAGLWTFELPEVFPCPIDIAHDGFGNYWVVDLTPASTRWGPIYFVCHDPPVVVLQSPNLSHFLLEALKLGGPDRSRSLLNTVHEVHSLRVWRENPELMDLDECSASGDPVLKSFAEELPEGSEVRDLRDAGVGEGFSWGRHGPRTQVRRAGDDPVFACEPRSWLQRFKDWMGWSG